MLGSLWAARAGDAIAVYSEVGNRTFAEIDANANRLVRALRRAGRGGRRRCCAAVLEPARVRRDRPAVRRAGLRLTTINWHLTADEAGYIVDDCDATGVRRRRTVRATRGRRRAGAPAARVLAVGGDDRRLRAVGRRARRGGRRRHRRSERRRHRCSTRRARPVGRRVCGERPTRAAISTSRRLTQYDPDAHVHLCTGPLYHAAPLAFSSRRPPRWACRS